MPLILIRPYPLNKTHPQIKNKDTPKKGIDRNEFYNKWIYVKFNF